MARFFYHPTPAQLCLILCDPVDCSPPGSSVHGILQARILEWVAISFSRGSSWPGNWTCISQISCIGRWTLLLEPLGNPTKLLSLVKVSFQLHQKGGGWAFFVALGTLHMTATQPAVGFSGPSMPCHVLEQFHPPIAPPSFPFLPQPTRRKKKHKDSYSCLNSPFSPEETGAVL